MSGEVLTAFRCSSAFAEHQVRGKAFRIDRFVFEELAHTFHGGGTDAKLRLVYGGERNAKIFTDENISETNDGDVFRNVKALFPEQRRGSDGNEIIAALDGTGSYAFVQHLERGCFTFFNGITRAEDEALIDLDLSFAQGAFIAIESFLVPRCDTRSGKVGDFSVTEREKMLGGGIGPEQVL